MVNLDISPKGRARVLLRARRALFGLNQDDLARALGCDRSQFSRFESGYLDLREEWVEPLAQALKWTPEEVRDACNQAVAA